jgi:hypothetical protein
MCCEKATAPGLAWGPRQPSCVTISTYRHPAGQITPDHPTDRGPFIYDAKREVLWLWNAVALPESDGEPCTVSGPTRGYEGLHVLGRAHVCTRE